MNPFRNGQGRLSDAETESSSELRAAQEELARRLAAVAELRAEVAAAREEARRAAHERDAAEERRADLAKLHVAARALHATLDPEEVLDALQEVVINLLGSECFAVYGFDPAGPSLAPLRTFGVDAGLHPAPLLGVGRVGHVVRTGAPELLPPDASRGEGEPVACIPLLAAGELVGVVVVYELLPQKDGFTGFDHELVDLLTVHAGTALLASRLHSRARAPLRPVAP